MAKEPVAHNHLPAFCYNAWGNTTTMTTRQLRETLLANGGQDFCQGRLCNVTKKSLGAGVYRVWLEPAK